MNKLVLYNFFKTIYFNIIKYSPCEAKCYINSYAQFENLTNNMAFTCSETYNVDILLKYANCFFDVRFFNDSLKYQNKFNEALGLFIWKIYEKDIIISLTNNLKTKKIIKSFIKQTNNWYGLRCSDLTSLVQNFYINIYIVILVKYQVIRFDGIIDRAFTWHESDEGYDFWHLINIKFKNNNNISFEKINKAIKNFIAWKGIIYIK